MADTLSQKVVNWARGKKGKQVKTGECWDLAEEALKQAGAKTSNDLGPVDADADYVWGDPVANLKDVLPGDILQFRDHTITVSKELEVTFEDGSGYTESNEAETTRPHHTAIVNAAKGNGAFELLEQNHENVKTVQTNQLLTKSVAATKTTTKKNMKDPTDGKMKLATVVETTTVTVTGTIWAYRPKQ
jgi:hypothetical protein